MYVAYAALMIMCRCAWYPLYTIFRCRLGVDEAIRRATERALLLFLRSTTYIPDPSLKRQTTKLRELNPYRFAKFGDL